jgi:hypothetical protein
MLVISINQDPRTSSGLKGGIVMLLLLLMLVIINNQDPRTSSGLKGGIVMFLLVVIVSYY